MYLKKVDSLYSLVALSSFLFVLFYQLLSKNNNTSKKRMISPEAMLHGHNDFTTSATKLRHFLENSNKILPCPGVYDGFSARVALSVGFSALYMVGGVFYYTSLISGCATLYHI